jgi:hypothetical protein
VFVCFHVCVPTSFLQNSIAHFAMYTEGRYGTEQFRWGCDGFW